MMQAWGEELSGPALLVWSDSNDAGSVYHKAPTKRLHGYSYTGHITQ